MAENEDTEENEGTMENGDEQSVQTNEAGTNGPVPGLNAMRERHKKRQEDKFKRRINRLL